MNTVELIGYYGSDVIIAQSAWTSTSRELTPEKLNRVPKLLKMLAEEGHHTPFEKSSLHFLVTTDIATHIQLLKHRIGVSINAESARYKELREDKYLLPEDWEGIKSTGKVLIKGQNWSDSWLEILKDFTEKGNRLYHQCLIDLEPIVGRKRAKESARFFKTYNSQITADVMFNFRSFIHFLNLRNKDEAQLEIKNLSNEMLRLVSNIENCPFKYTLQAFNLE